MKKKFLALLSLSLVAIFALLSGCSGATILTFENKFFGDGQIPAGYTETVTYQVQSGEFDSLKRDSSITEQVLQYDINGTFTTILTVYDAGLMASTFSQLGIDTDISYSDKGHVYYYQTSLELTANYTLNGQQLAPSIDTITTKAYFLDSAQSLSPIYSETIGSYSYLLDTDGDIQVSKLDIKYTTTYNKNSYLINQSYYAYKLGEFDQDAEWAQKTHEKSYTAKTIIDNNQLLFAIRNLPTVQENSNASLPTLSPVYGETKALAVKNTGTKTETLNNFGLNSTQVEVPVVCYEFYVNSNKNSGIQKYAFIQTDSANNLLPKAHLVKYVEPLFLLGGTFPCLGALIYTLTSVQ